MNIENKLGRFFRTTGVLRFFGPVGLILIIMGSVMLALPPNKYDTAEGTVTHSEAYTEYDTDNVLQEYYEVFFAYTVDGKNYTNSFQGYTEPVNKGEKITVYYDPDDPQTVSNSKNTGIISIVMIGLGAASLLFAILSTVRSVRKLKEMDEQIKTAAGTSELPEIIPLPKEELTEYYVSFDGQHLKPGYIVEDAARNVIFEAPMTKNALVGNRIFTFRDNRRGSVYEHEVGHTTTATYNNEFFSTNSWFSFDGRNIWDVLHDRGIRIATDLHSRFPVVVYTVSLNGRFFATIETSGRFVHEEDAAQHKVNIPVGSYYFRCWTDSEDIETLFLTVFAISETEQAVVE